jgi:hypothetical protein
MQNLRGLPGLIIWLRRADMIDGFLFPQKHLHRKRKTDTYRTRVNIVQKQPKGLVRTAS